MNLTDSMTSWSIQYYDSLTNTWCPFLFLGSYAYCNRTDTLKSALEELQRDRTTYKLFEHTVKRIA